MNLDVLSRLNAARARRQPAAVVTDIASGAMRFLEAADVAGDAFGGEISARLKSGKSGMIEDDGKETFVQVHVPPPGLVIIGAVHISQALVPIAQACNFDVTVIDPRTAFATPERFRDVNLRGDWPQEVLKDTPLDAFTALVALTHDPKIDDIPIKAALDAGCFYVGALGSRKTHGKRRDRLKDAGCDDEALDRIHAPIGLDIGAANPAEIAVAVMGEIISRLRKGVAT